MKISNLFAVARVHVKKAIRTFWEEVSLKLALGFKDTTGPARLNLPQITRESGYDVAIQVARPTRAGVETKVFTKKNLDSLDAEEGFRDYMSKNRSRYTYGGPANLDNPNYFGDGWLNITVSWKQHGVLCKLYVDTPFDADNISYSPDGVLTIQDPISRSLTLCGSEAAIKELTKFGAVNIPPVFGGEDIHVKRPTLLITQPDAVPTEYTPFHGNPESKVRAVVPAPEEPAPAGPNLTFDPEPVVS